MSILEPVYNGKIFGELKSSFSTTILEESNTYSVLREIELRGRIIINNCSYYYGELPITDNTIHLKHDVLGGIEIFPLDKQNPPLDRARKLNLYNIIIVNPRISNLQDIDGVRHGIIEGILYADLSKDATKTESINADLSKDAPKTEPINNITSVTTKDSDNGVIKPIPIPIDPIPSGDLINNRGCLGMFNPFNRNSSASPLLPLSQNQGCLPSGVGCLGVFKNGCAGILLLLLLFGILSLLLGYCSRHKTNEQDSTEYPEIKKGENADNQDNIKFDDQKITKDDFIKEKDSTSVIDKKTLKEYRTISLPNVQFFTNKAELLPTSKNDLDKLALCLLQNQELKAKIIGHTDSVGEKSKNLILSQKRAETVMKYLIDSGVSSDRLSALGKGDSEPRAENNTEEGKLMNRRVEVELVAKKVI